MQMSPPIETSRLALQHVARIDSLMQVVYIGTFLIKGSENAGFKFCACKS